MDYGVTQERVKEGFKIIYMIILISPLFSHQNIYQHSRAKKSFVIKYKGEIFLV